MPMEADAPDAIDQLSAELGRELLSDKIYLLLRQAILDGTQAPGTRIVESELARRLNVSQSPVREAVKRLVHEGLVTSIPRSGSYVTEVQEGESDAARQLRAVVERIGAERAASGAEPEILAKIEQIASATVAAAAEDDLPRLRMLDVEFHRSVLDAADSQVMSRVWRVLEPVLLSQRVIGDPNFGGDWALVAQEHVRLANLLRAGDPAAAGEAFRAHAAGEVQFGEPGETDAGLTPEGDTPAKR